ncbi:4'-phosphopantetheinyl transferase superfamily protein [Paracoccus sp. YIM 132242]|uniref:Enterobactin synthase component D n=1 Tax=Paracoccus lichenicola TaxID=2665644 RepID=A0A6L6HQT4_9RHOB|nr:4'-phosphopantetheinyl transferase superfamily protein [Paracoccus lichenicola]MTE01507.1 4'-phosphopantetheinyl transferase superfamily protein [Paracoccus lichenicola]
MRITAAAGEVCLAGQAADALARASQAIPLPPGARLAFVPVEPADPDRLPQAARTWAARRRNGFAAGRRAAAGALGAAGCRGDTVPGIGPDGLPAWPPGWFGSISHAETVATAIAVPVRGGEVPVLGIDLEPLIDPDTAADIAATIMPETLPGASGLPLAEEITRAFSAKEALYKALFPHTRRFRGFEAARVRWPASFRPGSPGVELTLAEDWGGEWRAGTRLAAFQAVAAGHVLTVVWRGTP